MFQEWMKIYNKIVYGKEDNMSKADKIFKEIGYEKAEDNETCVEYNKYYGGEVWEIIFWKEAEFISVSEDDFTEIGYITMKTLQI